MWLSPLICCLTVKFLPASKFTTAPGFTLVAVDVPSSSPVDLVAFANQPLLLIASTTVFTVAKPSLPLTPVLPSAPFVILPVFTSYLTTPFAATDAVVKLPSVKFKPSVNATVWSFTPFALYLILNALDPGTFAFTLYVVRPTASVELVTVTELSAASTIVPKPVITFLPSLVILVRSLFAALSILSLVSWVKSTVTFAPAAVVVTYLALSPPTTLNSIPSFLDSF